MPQGDKPASTAKRKRQTGASENGDQPRGVAGPNAAARAWANVNKLPGGGKKVDARRKLPSGPLGGSGRKTNSSRSS